MSKIILAIETSCDETAAAVLEDNYVLSNIIASQYFHREFGGIVPELASRAHIKIIDRIVRKALEESKVDPQKIGYAAATAGPGLIGSLLVGFNYAKGYAISGGLEFIPVNHIESHLFSSFIGSMEIEFPFISLVVSGGHTLLFYVTVVNKYEVLGETQDDAAGEAFDKVGKMLGLDYPAGPLIDDLASKGNENFHKFPVANLKENKYDFSFSGIKTSVLYYLKKNYKDAANIPLNDICASFQKAVVDSLVEKTILAAKDHGVKIITVSGGVSANNRLRTEFNKYTSKGFRIYFPEKKYSTDNAAMIGYLAYLKLKGTGNFDNEAALLTEAFPKFRI